MRAEILVVCGSDACLAPAAAVALRAVVAGTPVRAVVDIVSAGVRGDGVPWCEEAASAAPRPFAERARWVHRSRQVSSELVHRAGLVLVTERRFRSAIRLLDRHSAPRTFTLTEAAALASAVARDSAAVPLTSAQAPTEDEYAEQLRWLVEEMDAHRGLVGLETQAPWRRSLVRRVEPAVDILDPHDERSASHKRSLARIDASVQEIAGALTRSPSRTLVT